MNKIEIPINLTLTPEQLEALRRECRININTGCSVNDVDLSPVYKQLLDQILEHFAPTVV